MTEEVEKTPMGLVPSVMWTWIDPLAGAPVATPATSIPQNAPVTPLFEVVMKYWSVGVRLVGCTQQAAENAEVPSKLVLVALADVA